MSIPLENDRRERFNTLENQTIIDLYSSPESGAFLRKVYEQNGLTISYKNFVTIIGDVILGFYSVQKLPELFVEELSLPQESALKITNELLEFLSPLLVTTANEASHLTPNAFAGAANVASEPVHIMQSESELLRENNNTVAPVGYQTDNEEHSGVPRYQKPLTDTPAYNDTDPSHGNPR